MKTQKHFSFEQPKVEKVWKFENYNQDIEKKLDKKEPQIAQYQCSLSKIEMAATPAPSVVKTTN